MFWFVPASQCETPQLPPGAEISNPAEPGIGFYLSYRLDIKCPDGSASVSECRNSTGDYEWTNIYCPGKYIDTSRYTIIEAVKLI